MDFIVYSWLLNSKEQSPKLIDCILKLSCNDLFISYGSLVNYYNNNYTTLNKLYGLSDKQFNILHNNIVQLQDLINNNNNNTISKTDEIHISSSKNDKFDWSINIIIYNNNNNKDSNNNQIIKHYNNSNNNQQQRGSRNREMNQLFYMVWRNIIIRNEIIYHTRLYRIHSNVTQTFTVQTLNEYKYKSYINSLNFRDLADEENEEGQILKPNSIPYGVRYIDFFDSIHKFEMNSIPDSVTRITFPDDFNQNISKGIIPDSVTSIKFYQFNQSLDGGWLPKSITYLDLSLLFHQSISPGQLPESLTELILPKKYKGTIIAGSIPFAVKNLDYTFNSKNGELLTSDTIPNATTNLVFDHSFKQDIKVGDIPHNVTSLKFESYQVNIKPNSLPISLKTLFSNPSSALVQYILPSNLTFIDLGQYNYQLTPNIFPMSITTLKISAYNRMLPVGYFYKYSNLTTLKLGKFDQDEIPLKTLPSSLTDLNIPYYRGPIGAITELKSLKTLSLGGEEREIVTGQLPQSITSLSLSTSLPIGPNLLPSNLKELYIENSRFECDISIDGYLPTQSLESVHIYPNSLDFINCLNVNFFHKYIKLIEN